MDRSGFAARRRVEPRALSALCRCNDPGAISEHGAWQQHARGRSAHELRLCFRAWILGPEQSEQYIPDKPPGNIILQGEEHDIPKVPRRAPWGGTRWFNVRGSRWLDVVKVENGQMTHMYDMKFPGDKFPNDPTKNAAYEAIALRHRARYKEFVVLDECDNCEEAVRQREQERQWEAEERWRQLKKGLENGPPIWLPLPGPRLPGGRRPPIPSW